MKVLALSIGRSTAGALGLLTMMVMARLLTKEDLAAYNQTILAYTFFAPFLGLGIGQGIYYFIPTEKIRIRGRVLDAITILSSMGLLFALFLGAGGNQLIAKQFSSPKVAELLLWMIPYAAISTPAAQYSSVMVARDNVVHSSIFTVIRQFSIGIATVVPVLIWQTAEAPLIGNVIASLLFGIEAIRLMIKATPNDSTTPSRSGITEMVKFSAPLGLAAMLGTISAQIDKVIVAVMCTAEEFAVYSLGAIELPFIAIITGAFSAVLLTDMRKAILNNQSEEAHKLFKITAEKTSLLIFPAMLFLLVCAEPFILTIYGNEYVESVEPFRLYLLRLPARIVVFGSLLIALGENLFILKRTIISLTFGSILSIILVRTMGSIGAVTGGLIVFYTYAIPSCFYVLAKRLKIKAKQVLPLSLLLRNFLLSLPVSVISMLTMMALHESRSDIKLVVASILSALYCFWLWNNRLYSLQKSLLQLRMLIKR